MDWLDTNVWTLEISITVFAICVVVIVVSGTALTGIADRLADRTGLGEAIVGAVLLGATTSLAGSVLSVSAAWHGRAELAMANALGGIAAQTAFLAVADIVYRPANLEHAAASAANMMQGALLNCLLGILLMGAFAPNVTILGVHPITPFLFGTYVYGIWLVRSARTTPMWQPRETTETRTDQPEAGALKLSLLSLMLWFIGLALIMGIAGWVLEKAATGIATRTGLGQTEVGILLTSITTSLPELVTSVAAVRRGALTLAVGGIIGGNAFDTLFAGFSDIAYREGSIYHATSNQLLLWIALTIFMTAVLLMGQIRREEQGIGAIGFESFTILVLYLGAVVLLLFA